MKFTAHILVVEDDAAIRNLFEKLLGYHHIQADIVGNAEKALALLDHCEFDLIVADIHLPGMDGLEMLRRIRKKSNHIDVILMSADVEVNKVLSAIKMGVYDYLLKPFESLNEVIQKIERALSKRRMVLENQRLLRYLTDANTQIEDMNRSLEAQVIKRTQQLEAANRRLQELSLTDEVTGLYNQRFLFRRLDEEFRRHQRYQHGLAVIMMDIDHFKIVNDTHDHLFGSQVLARVGTAIVESVRNTDFAIRYGGDEFAVIMPNTLMEGAELVSERIRRQVAATNFGEEGPACLITMSIGVAATDRNTAHNGRALLRAADKALYTAKSGGRNRVMAAAATLARAS
ncbi:MAG: diguanylate cyclase [Myxococcota bacterium]